MAYNRPKKDEKSKEVQHVEPKRTMKGSLTLHHDLFKLKSAKFMKILGVPDPKLLAKPNARELVRMVDVDHCHFFHTVDSNGKHMEYSAATGGHCHKVTIKVGEDGEFVAECGPPVRKMKHSRVDAAPNLYDKHTHEIEYIHSEEFQVRNKSAKAVQFQSQFETPPAPRDVK